MVRHEEIDRYSLDTVFRQTDKFWQVSFKIDIIILV